MHPKAKWSLLAFIIVLILSLLIFLLIPPAQDSVFAGSAHATVESHPTPFTPLSTTSTAAPTPLDPIMRVSRVLQEMDSDLLATCRSISTPEEAAYSAGVHSLLAAQKKLLVIYSEKINPEGHTPFPPALIYLRPVNEWDKREIIVQDIDEQTADVIVPNFARYRVKLIAGEWKILTGATIANEFPSDPAKAIKGLTLLFEKITVVYDGTINEITRGTLTSPDAVFAYLTPRYRNALEEGSAELPSRG